MASIDFPQQAETLESRWDYDECIWTITAFGKSASKRLPETTDFPVDLSNKRTVTEIKWIMTQERVFTTVQTIKNTRIPLQDAKKLELYETDHKLAEE